MRAIMALLSLLIIFGQSGEAQIITKDYLVNDPGQNLNGVGRTAIAAMPGGSFAVAWQDFNDYNAPVAEGARIAVRMFSPKGTPISPLNLFQGESHPPFLWSDDFLDPNPDLAYLPDGTLLVAVEHEGFVYLGPSDVGSSEVGLGMIAANGTKLDGSGPGIEGEILWLAPPIGVSTTENPRVAVAPSGEFFVVLDGPSTDTEKNGVAIQLFDSAINFVGDFFTPHLTDLPPQSHHLFPDVASNGTFHVVVWQDGRRDSTFDISAQFYNNAGPVGGNLRVNNGDPQNVFNIVPSVAMNANGNSVVVWVDTRNNPAGEIFGQLYNSAGQAIGDNFQVSAQQGEIFDRAEVAMVNDGSFMVVWTDTAGGDDLSAFRARARQFDAGAHPLGPPFTLVNGNVPSGLANIATDGVNYYCSWLDDRLGNNNPNVYARKIPSG